MKELQNILQAFEQIKAANQRAAIATVVKTSGSVYRRPGARMLITETGQSIGAISGGCLESDVFERAQPMMVQGGHPICVHYDTAASNDVIWGLGMGCNGAVEVLIESLDTASAQSSLELIAACFQQQQSGVIATVFRGEGELSPEMATRLFVWPDGTVLNNIAHQQLSSQLLQDTYQALAIGKNQVTVYHLEQGLAEVLIEVIHPPVPLHIFGAGYDAVPVVQLAKQLGWQVTVIDHRPAYATRDRFPQADQIIVCHAHELSATLPFNPHSVAIVMTHQYLQDQALLKTLLPAPIRYLGVLGPKQRTQQLLDDLQAEGFGWTETQLQRLHAPIGLDIGAETPEEIALAIVAEIQATLTGRPGNSLRSRAGAIHGPISPCLALV